MTVYGNDHFDLMSAKVIFAAFTGDVKGLEYFISIGGAELLNTPDYDGRTALHLACAEGRVPAVKVRGLCRLHLHFVVSIYYYSVAHNHLLTANIWGSDHH